MKRPDTEIIASWVHGWALTRGAATPTAIPGGLRVAVGLPEQLSRSVLYNGDLTIVGATMEENDAPWNFLKVCAEPNSLKSGISAPWVMDDHVWMMVGPSSSSASAPTPPSMTLSLQENGVLITAEVRDEAGNLAARGKGALACGRLIFDQIVTEPDFRRRGLASAIMSAIGKVARDSGVESAVLVATRDGAALYTALGWRIESPVTSIVIPGA